MGTPKPEGEMGRHSLKISCFTVHVFLTIKMHFEILNLVDIGESCSSKLSGVKDQEMVLKSHGLSTPLGLANCPGSCGAENLVSLATPFYSKVLPIAF